MKRAVVFVVELAVLTAIVLGFIWAMNLTPWAVAIGLLIVLALMVLRRLNAHTGG